MRSFFLMDREIIDHDVVGIRNPKRFAAWSWMLSEARWRKGTASFGSKTMALDRGQFSCSLRFMADNIGFSVQELRTFLNVLRNNSMIKTEIESGQFLITICNYNIFQDFDKYETAPDDQQQEVVAEPVVEIEIKKPKAKARGRRLTSDWVAPKSFMEYGLSKGLSRHVIEEEIETMRNWSMAAAGKAGIKLDWLAAWRNWIGRYLKDNPQQTRKGEKW